MHRPEWGPHTARFRLVPALAKTLTVATPPIRKPGTLWIELPRPIAAGTETDLSFVVMPAG